MTKLSLDDLAVDGFATGSLAEPMEPFTTDQPSVSGCTCFPSCLQPCGSPTQAGVTVIAR